MTSTQLDWEGADMGFRALPANAEKLQCFNSRYLPAKGPATPEQFTSARRIINEIDRAEKVAGYVMSFQAALIAGRWS